MEVQVGYQEQFCPWKSGQELEGAAQVGGGVLEVVKNCAGTAGHGLVGNIGGRRMVGLILEIVSNLGEFKCFFQEMTDSNS